MMGLAKAMISWLAVWCAAFLTLYLMNRLIPDPNYALNAYWFSIRAQVKP